MRLEIKFDLGNDAFVDDPDAEVLRVLQRLGRELWANQLCRFLRESGTEDGGIVQDVNGNTIGNWRILQKETP